MALTKAELRSVVVENTRRSDKTSLIDIALNLALEQITNRHSFKSLRVEESVSIATDATMFGLPEGCKRVVDVRISDESSVTTYPLVIETKRGITRQYPNLQSTVSGRPYVGFEEGGSIRFSPAASQNFLALVTFDKNLKLSEDTDEIGIDGLDTAVIAYATSYVFRSIQMNEEAAVWEGTFEKELLLAIRSDSRKPANVMQSKGFPGPPVEPTTPPYLDPFVKGN